MSGRGAGDKVDGRGWNNRKMGMAPAREMARCRSDAGTASMCFCPLALSRCSVQLAVNCPPRGPGDPGPAGRTGPHALLERGGAANIRFSVTCMDTRAIPVFIAVRGVIIQCVVPPESRSPIMWIIWLVITNRDCASLFSHFVRALSRGNIESALEE